MYSRFGLELCYHCDGSFFIPLLPPKMVLWLRFDNSSAKKNEFIQ